MEEKTLKGMKVAGWAGQVVGVLSGTGKFVPLIPGQGTYLGCALDPWSEHVRGN